MTNNTPAYKHFLEQEIMAQPETLAKTLRGRIDPSASPMINLKGLNLSPDQLKNLDRIIIIGCGTAYHAGVLASYHIAQFAPMLGVETIIASECRYRQTAVPKNSLIIAVSQSGETADTLACLRDLKKQGIKTAGVINAIDSTIAKEVDGGVYLHVGPEVSIASTKAFTSQVVVLTMIGLAIAEAKGVSPDILRPFVEEITQLPAAIAQLLKTAPAKVQSIAEKYANYDHAVYLGRGIAYPAAMEGALKLKETSYTNANAYSSAEFKHGPIAIIDDRFFEFFLLPTGESYADAIKNLEDVLARDSHLIAVTNDPDFSLPVADLIKISTPLQIFTPLLMNVVSQLFAYYFTLAKGYDVDHPRSLVKAVVS